VSKLTRKAREGDIALNYTEAISSLSKLDIKKKIVDYFSKELRAEGYPENEVVNNFLENGGQIKPDFLLPMKDLPLITQRLKPITA
jgi:hypothetical protein